jgi:hypothetical protein
MTRSTRDNFGQSLENFGHGLPHSSYLSRNFGLITLKLNRPPMSSSYSSVSARSTRPSRCTLGLRTLRDDPPAKDAGPLNGVGVRDRLDPVYDLDARQLAHVYPSLLAESLIRSTGPESKRFASGSGSRPGSSLALYGDSVLRKPCWSPAFRQRFFGVGLLDANGSENPIRSRTATAPAGRFSRPGAWSAGTHNALAAWPRTDDAHRRTE